jgi:hypothetical protein
VFLNVLLTACFAIQLNTEWANQKKIAEALADDEKRALRMNARTTKVSETGITQQNPFEVYTASIIRQRKPRRLPGLSS